MKVKTKMTHKAVFSSGEIETLALILNYADAYVARRKDDNTYERAAESLLAVLNGLDDYQAQALSDVACVLADVPTHDYPEVC